MIPVLEELIVCQNITRCTGVYSHAHKFSSLITLSSWLLNPLLGLLWTNLGNYKFFPIPMFPAQSFQTSAMPCCAPVGSGTFRDPLPMLTAAPAPLPRGTVPWEEAEERKSRWGEHGTADKCWSFMFVFCRSLSLSIAPPLLGDRLSHNKSVPGDWALRFLELCSVVHCSSSLWPSHHPPEMLPSPGMLPCTET